MGEELLRICGIGVLCALSALLLQKKEGELAALLRTAGILLVVGFLTVRLGALPNGLAAFLEEGDVGEYAAIMLKALGIALVSHTCASVCRECGAATVATGVEAAGNLGILLLCLPLLEELVQNAQVLLTWR